MTWLGLTAASYNVKKTIAKETGNFFIDNVIIGLKKSESNFTDTFTVYKAFYWNWKNKLVQISDICFTYKEW